MIYPWGLLPIVALIYRGGFVPQRGTFYKLQV